MASLHLDLNWSGGMCGIERIPKRKGISSGQFGTMQWRFICGEPNLLQILMMNVTCAVHIPKTIAHRFAIGGMLAKLRILPLVSSTPWTQDKRDHGNRLIDNMGISTFKILFALSNYSRIWLLLRVLTVWTIWVERNNLTFNNSRQRNEKMKQTIGKTYLNTLELHGQRCAEKRRRLPSMMIHLVNMTRFEVATNSFIIEITLGPCIGTIEHLMWA